MEHPMIRNFLLQHKVVASVGARERSLYDKDDDEDIRHCDNCEDEVHTSEALEFDGMVFCETCFDENYYHCDVCDEIITYDSSIYIEDDGRVCSNCYDSQGCFYCEECEHDYNEEERADCEEDICQYCFEKSPNQMTNPRLHPALSICKPKK